MVLLGQHVSIEQESMYCGSSMSKLTSGQPVKDNAGLMGACSGFIGTLAKYRIDVQGFCFLLHAALYI